MGKQLAIIENGVFVTGSQAFLTVDGVHRKALKMFRTTDGVHRLCFSGGVNVATMAISYTGNMTDEIVTMSGVQYRLLTLTSSGTLTADQEANAEVWMCNGGNGGRDSGYGGGGGYIASAVIALPLSAVAVVGSGGGEAAYGGVSRFADVSPKTPTGNIQNGASGGGGHEGSSGGSGTGETTYPFGDAVYFTGKPHSAGGGGGAYWYCDYRGYTDVYDGGDGGSNGSNGKKSYENPSSQLCGGTGGAYGGGDGGYDMEDGYNATFYGGGGGGGALSADENAGSFEGEGGSGYQGVIYVRIPLEQAE